jgi:hypothetical protein
MWPVSAARAAVQPLCQHCRVDTVPADEPLYSERIVWAASYPLAAVLLAAGAVELFDRWALGAIFIAAALGVVWFCRARYTVSGRGVDVVVGGGRPHLFVAADDVQSVEPTRISLRNSGGWGYRGSWTMSKGVAISLGGNGAVVITSRSGKQLRLSSRHPDDRLSAAATLIR